MEPHSCKNTSVCYKKTMLNIDWHALKGISHKVRGPTRSENARHLLVWVYRERWVHILYVFWAYYTQSPCWFCTTKASLRPPLHHAMCSLVKASRMRQSQKVAHAWWGLDCDLRPNERKKKKEAGILTRAFPLESPSKNYAFLGILERQIVFQAGNRLVQLGANRSLLV